MEICDYAFVTYFTVALYLCDCTKVCIHKFMVKEWVFVCNATLIDSGGWKRRREQEFACSLPGREFHDVDCPKWSSSHTRLL